MEKIVGEKIRKNRMERNESSKSRRKILKLNSFNSYNIKKTDYAGTEKRKKECMSLKTCGA